MSVNIPLLRKAVEWAEAEAAKPVEQCQWFQAEYSIPADVIHRTCGTCYCIAGYVLHLDGQSATWEPCSPSERAAALLGINPNYHNGGEGLFDQDNTIEDVRRIAEEIAGERL